MKTYKLKQINFVNIGEDRHAATPVGFYLIKKTRSGFVATYNSSTHIATTEKRIDAMFACYKHYNNKIKSLFIEV